MRRSKRIFAIVAFVFFLLLAFVVYDISNRTTFPGSPPPADRPENDGASDSSLRDSVR